MGLSARASTARLTPNILTPPPTALLRCLSIATAGAKVLIEGLRHCVLDCGWSCHVYERGDALLGRVGNANQPAGGGVYLPGIGD